VLRFNYREATITRSVRADNCYDRSGIRDHFRELCGHAVHCDCCGSALCTDLPPNKSRDP
jgi:hypothetical protein